MKIVVVTPLYPPEIAEPAPYIKELAKRLAGRHEITVVTYGRLPEKVAGVSIVSVDKRRPRATRLIAYLRALRHAAKYADIIYAQNGASVELPLLLSLTGKPIIMHVGDTAAHERAKNSWLLRLLERLAFAQAKIVITDSPLARPEILPLAPHPDAELAAYEDSWAAHLHILENAFSHAQ